MNLKRLLRAAAPIAALTIVSVLVLGTLGVLVNQQGADELSAPEPIPTATASEYISVAECTIVERRERRNPLKWTSSGQLLYETEECGTLSGYESLVFPNGVQLEPGHSYILEINLANSKYARVVGATPVGE